MHLTAGGGWFRLKLRKNAFIHKVVVYNMFYDDWFTSNPISYCFQNPNYYLNCLNNNDNVEISVMSGDNQRYAALYTILTDIQLISYFRTKLSHQQDFRLFNSIQFKICV